MEGCRFLEDVLISQLRCHRLNKLCVPSSPAKRRGPKPKDASRATPVTASLEKKLDDLMSLMRVQQSRADFARDSASHVESDDDNDHSNDASPALTDNTLISLQTDEYVDVPSVEEAEICLQRFRKEMMVTPLFRAFM